MRIKMECYLPLAQFGVREVIGAYLHVRNQMDGEAQFKENAQFSGFFFLSRY